MSKPKHIPSMTEILASFPDPPLDDRRGRVYYRWDWHADKLTKWFEEARAAILRARGQIDEFERSEGPR